MSKQTTLFFLITTILTCSCSLLGTERIGDVPAEVRIDAIKANKHTKEDVTRLLGSPTSITLFEKESWLYIESQEQNRLFLPQKEIDRRVVQISFDANGTVKKVKKYALKDGKQVAFDNNTTSVQGKDLSVVDEMIGNFGRFSTGKNNDR